MQPNDTVRKRRSDYQPRIERPCEVCTAPVFATPRTIALGKGRFCGAVCFAESRRTTITRSCERCLIDFQVSPARGADGRGRFCSKTCYDDAQRDETPVEVRLWERVDQHGAVPPHRAEYGSCWLWTGYCNSSGYGRLYRHFPEAVLSHRLAWELATGETLTAHDVIGHICDVRHCVRNDDTGWYNVAGVLLPRRGHLFKGTHTNNHDDMVEKRRHSFGDRNGSRTRPERLRRGSRSPMAKLTEHAVREIRRRYAAGGISQTALALEYGVHNVTISEIVLRKKWRHVD